MKDIDDHSILNPSNRLKETFVVKIEHCQNNTWQGKVVWADENKKVTFRSALELMNLMNEAMAHAKSQGERTAEHSVS